MLRRQTSLINLGLCPHGRFQVGDRVCHAELVLRNFSIKIIKIPLIIFAKLFSARISKFKALKPPALVVTHQAGFNPPKLVPDIRKYCSRSATYVPLLLMDQQSLIPMYQIYSTVLSRYKRKAASQKFWKPSDVPLVFTQAKLLAADGN